MLGRLLLQPFKKAVLGAASWLDAHHVGPGLLTLLSCGLLLGAAVAVAGGHYGVAAVAVLVAGCLELLGDAAGRDAKWDTDVFGFVGVGTVVLAFALADPSRALAVAFLLLALGAACVAAQTTRGLDAREDALSRVATLADRPEIYAALLLACLLPERFSIIAYVFGFACFVAVGVRLSVSASSNSS